VDFGSRLVLPFCSRPQHRSPFSARSQVFGLVFCSCEGQARQGFCLIRYHVEDFPGGPNFGHYRRLFSPTRVFSGWIRFSLRRSVCPVVFRCGRAPSSGNASCFWFSLLSRLNLLSAVGLSAVALAADFFTRGCCSIRSLPPS
jgi:hypothetical protein